MNLNFHWLNFWHKPAPEPGLPPPEPVVLELVPLEVQAEDNFVPPPEPEPEPTPEPPPARVVRPLPPWNDR